MMGISSQSQARDASGKRQSSNKSSESYLFQHSGAPAAVLFDWDNTLVDTWKTIFYALNDTLLAFGLEPWSEDYAQTNIQQSGREAFPKLFGDRAQDAQKFFYKIVEEDNLQGLNPLPEAKELLEIITQKGIPVGVVSNKSSRFLRKEVHHLGWQHYFGVLVGAGDALRDKPAADPVLLALLSLGIPVGQNVWMIGDAPVDWDSARAAGCQPIAVGNRFEPTSSVIVSFENCAELKKIFAKM